MILTIPGRLPDLNDMIDAARRNKITSANMKKDNTEVVAWIAKSKRIPHFDRVDITITWIEPNQKRDKDNIMAAQKFILDGLVMARVLDNDGWKQIGDILHRFKVDRMNPRIEIDIKEV